MYTRSFCLIFILIVFSACQSDDQEIIKVIEPYVEEPLAEGNLITSFQLSIQGSTVSGTINQEERLITIDVDDADLSSIQPIIEYSDKATISPAATVPQNFDEEVVYKVIAENGDPNIYRVVVNNISSSNDILDFQLNIYGKIYQGTVDNTAATLYVETDQIVDLAEAVFSVSDGATIAPVKENPQNFYEPVQYIVTAENGATKTFTLTTKAYEFFNNGGNLFYSNAISSASGTGIDLSIPNSSVVLENGQNSYTLQNILTMSSSYYSNGMPYNSFTYNFPDNIVTATDYKLKYLIDGEVKTTSTFSIDVLADNVPIITSLNQNIYVVNDILLITGENLPDTISIPSNGSVFIIKNSNNYDLEVNNERTELTVTLDYSYLFPSYFGRPQEDKIITLYGPNLRVGPTVTTIFK